MDIDMEDFTLDMIISQAKAAQLKKKTDAEKLPALFDKTLDALVSACEKLEAITAERDRLAAKLDCFTMIMKEIYDELDDAEEDPIPSSLWDLYSTTPDQCFADIRAKAVMKFAEVPRGAYLSGFVTAELTVYDVYQSARNHVKDNYGYDTPIWDGADAEDAINAIKKLRDQTIRKFVSDTNDTGQLSWPDCQWLEQWHDEWLEEAAKGGE